MSRKGALLLSLLFLWGCAERSPPPRDLSLPQACYRALVSYRLRAPGTGYRGKAVVLAAGPRLYAEGFSPLGGAAFVLWFSWGKVLWLSPLGEQGRGLSLRPENRRFADLWPYLLVGRLPPGFKLRGRVSLGKGYSLEPQGGFAGIRVRFRGRNLLDIRRQGQTVILRFPPFRMVLSLRVLRFETVCASLPEAPSLPLRVLDLENYLSVSGD